MEETYAYREDPGRPGVYAARRFAIVQPGRTYALDVAVGDAEHRRGQPAKDHDGPEGGASQRFDTLTVLHDTRWEQRQVAADILRRLEAHVARVRNGVELSEMLRLLYEGRTPAEVAQYAGDPTNAPEWYANIKSIDWQTPPPVAVGSRMDFVAQFLGRRMAYTYEVVELVPDETLVMRTADGPFPMETTYRWEPVEGGTRMTLRNRGNPSGFAQLTGPLMERAMRRATTKDLARLKSLLER